MTRIKLERTRPAPVGIGAKRPGQVGADRESESKSVGSVLSMLERSIEAGAKTTSYRLSGAAT